MTAIEVETQFKAELQALLDKYGAELEAKDYVGLGGDVRMTVHVDGVYDADGNTIREFTAIDLGA